MCMRIILIQPVWTLLRRKDDLTISDSSLIKTSSSEAVKLFEISFKTNTNCAYLWISLQKQNVFPLSIYGCAGVDIQGKASQHT